MLHPAVHSPFIKSCRTLAACSALTLLCCCLWVLSSSSGLQQSPSSGEDAGKAMFDALYANRKQLEAMFAFFDKDGNGSISR